MYKMSWSDQKKNVWWGRRDERGKKRGSSTLSYIQQLAPKQLSAVTSASQTMTRVHEDHHKVTGGSCHALTSSRAEEKMKPGDFFFVVLFDCHSLFLMFVCNIQRKMFGTTNSADQMKANIHFGERQTASSVHQTGERRLPPESQNPQPCAEVVTSSAQMTLKKKKVFNTHASSPRRVQRQS